MEVNMNWVLARLSEPSTWYGAGVLVAGIAAHFAPDAWAAFLHGVQFVGAGAAIFTPEKA
jgi:hypothetical protein